MSRYVKKTEEEKRHNRMMGQIKQHITKRLNKPMPNCDWSDGGVMLPYWSKECKTEIQYNQWKEQRDAKIS